MYSPNEGSVWYDEPADKKLTVIDSPDTHARDVDEVEIEWEDGTWGTKYCDHFSGKHMEMVSQSPDSHEGPCECDEGDEIVDIDAYGTWCDCGCEGAHAHCARCGGVAMGGE